MKLLIPFVLLSLNAYPCFSLDLSGYRNELAGLGTPETALAPAAVPEVPRRYTLAYETFLLQTEALADPDKFIDEHTPAEVSIAFGFTAQDQKALLTDQARIQKAALRITVDLTRQRLITQSSGTIKEFKISSGLPPSHSTPGSGKCYLPDTLETMHYSSLYNNAPMPNTVFFNGNIALHGTSAEDLLGQPASHGCVRLSKADSKTVYDMVRANGKTNSVICVQGITPKKDK